MTKYSTELSEVYVRNHGIAQYEFPWGSIGPNISYRGWSPVSRLFIDRFYNKQLTLSDPDVLILPS